MAKSTAWIAFLFPKSCWRTCLRPNDSTGFSPRHWQTPLRIAGLALRLLFLLIMEGAYLLLFVIVMPETCQNVVDDRIVPPQSCNMSLLNHLHISKLRISGANLTGLRERQALARKRKLRFPYPLGTLCVINQKDVGRGTIVVLQQYCIHWGRRGGGGGGRGGISSHRFHPCSRRCTDSTICRSDILSSPSGRIYDCPVRRREIDGFVLPSPREQGFPIDKKRGYDLKNFLLVRARLQVAAPLLPVGIASILWYGWVLDRTVSCRSSGPTLHNQLLFGRRFHVHGGYAD